MISLRVAVFFFFCRVKASSSVSSDAVDSVRPRNISSVYVDVSRKPIVVGRHSVNKNVERMESRFLILVDFTTCRWRIS